MLLIVLYRRRYARRLPRRILPPDSSLPMTIPTTPKRWRPRFSVRTLVVLVTLVCCYAACWAPTKRSGVSDVDTYVNWRGVADATRNVNGASAALPLVVAIDERDYEFDPFYYNRTAKRCYYFWFFGYVAKLPYEHQYREEIPTQRLKSLRIRVP